MRAGTLLLLLAALLPAACKRQDMYAQGYAKTWDRSTFFKNQSTMRHPPEGAVARETHYPDVPAKPTVIDAALIDRGHERFNIFCTPCHGFAGNGRGMIVQRGFPQAPSFVEGRLRTADASVFYSAITNGYGAMYSYDTRIPPADRWAIIAYIRALQRSQNTDPASLPPADRARLEAAR